MLLSITSGGAPWDKFGTVGLNKARYNTTSQGN